MHLVTKRNYPEAQQMFSPDGLRELAGKLQTSRCHRALLVDCMIDTAAVQSPARGLAGDTRETEPAPEQIVASGTRMADDGIPEDRGSTIGEKSRA